MRYRIRISSEQLDILMLYRIRMSSEQLDILMRYRIKISSDQLDILMRYRIRMSSEKLDILHLKTRPQTVPQHRAPHTNWHGAICQKHENLV